VCLLSRVLAIVGTWRRQIREPMRLWLRLSDVRPVHAVRLSTLGRLLWLSSSVCIITAYAVGNTM